MEFRYYPEHDTKGFIINRMELEHQYKMNERKIKDSFLTGFFSAGLTTLTGIGLAGLIYVIGEESKSPNLTPEYVTLAVTGLAASIITVGSLINRVSGSRKNKIEYSRALDELVDSRR